MMAEFKLQEASNLSYGIQWLGVSYSKRYNGRYQLYYR